MIFLIPADSKIKCTQKGEKKYKVPQVSAKMKLPQQNLREDTMGRNKLTIENIARHTHFDWDQRIQMQYYYAGMDG
jgi:hypothetical protein